MRYICALGLSFVFLLSISASYAKGGEDMAFKITSPDFTEAGRIPEKFTCEGEDLSPELNWEGSPEGTLSYVLIVEDPDAPRGTFIHWVVYDLPAAFHKMHMGMGNDPDLADGIKHGVSDFGNEAYGGPCPPRSHGTHRYFFILRALDVKTLGIGEGAKKSDVERAMKGHVLAETRLMGTFSR